ncbi:RidA family protein [Lysinimonas soli]|uniref:RidA family protein n=1 Tax=Lysinimonas soli TaxID=1074233 RepID=A0ABW0NTI4_9MICO
MTMQLARVPGQSAMLPGGVRAGDMIFTSGIVSPTAFARFGIESTTDAIDFDTQAEEALASLLSVLEGLGGSADTVVKLDAYLSDARHFAAWNAAYLRIWPTPGPARTTLVAAFATTAVDIEVQAVAVLV